MVVRVEFVWYSFFRCFDSSSSFGSSFARQRVRMGGTALCIFLGVADSPEPTADGSASDVKWASDGCAEKKRISVVYTYYIEEAWECDVWGQM